MSEPQPTPPTETIKYVRRHVINTPSHLLCIELHLIPNIATGFYHSIKVPKLKLKECYPHSKVLIGHKNKEKLFFFFLTIAIHLPHWSFKETIQEGLIICKTE